MHSEDLTTQSDSSPEIVNDVSNPKFGHDVIRQIAELDALYNTVSIGLCAWDTELRYVRINPVLAEMNGVPLADHIGRKFEEVLPDIAITQAPLIRQVIETGTSLLNVEAQGMNPKQPGVLRDWRVSYVPLKDAAGTVIGVSASVEEVTELKQAQARSQASDDRFQSFFNANLIGVLFGDVYGGVKSANDEFLRIIGYSREELEVGQVRWTEITPPEYLPLDAERIAQAQAEGTCTPYEKEYIRKDGQRVSVMVGYGLYGANRAESIAFILDITELKQAEKALRDSEARFRLLADNIAQLAWITDEQGWIFWYNQRWFDYTGTTLEEMQGWGWRSVHHPDHLDRVLERWREHLAKGETWEDTFPLRGKDGKFRWFLSRALPIRDEQGRILHWFGTNTDISDRKQLEDALKKQTTELIRANQIKDEFLAVVSHELRTPLNPILGWSKLLQMKSLNETQTTTALETIHRNAERQAQLIDDLLDMSRILRGKLQLDCRAVNLSDVITAALETVQLQADAKQIRIERQILEPAIVWADPTRLQQVVWNLLSNAVKFTPEQGLVKVHIEVMGSHAQIQVIDSGKGIAPDFLPYVFERFQQEDSSSTRKFGGLGLGLAIVRQLTELQGGTVKADSPGENQGATFTVKLPLLESALLHLSERPQPSAIADLQNVCVLVVEDEIDSLELLTFILEEAGATVLKASSGSEALRHLESRSPTIIVSDIAMPEMNGYMLLRQLREKQEIPAIALTAYASDSDRATALQAGFQAHLSKPIEPDIVIATVLQVITSSSS